MNMRRIGIVVGLAALLLGVLSVWLQSGVSGAASASQTGFHKVIAPAGVLADGRSDITLWHDYGRFALYKVSDVALANLPASVMSRITVADEMDRVLIDAHPFDTQRDQLDWPVAEGKTAVSSPSLHLIQFVGPIKAEWLDAVTAAGAVPIHYIANNAYLVWVDGDGRNQLQTLVQTGDFLQYSAPYADAFKLGRSLADRLAAGKETAATVPVVIQMLRHPGQEATATLLKKLLISADANWQPIRKFQNISGVVRLADIPAIIAQPDVLWVGEQFERELLDEVQGQILAANFDGGMTGPSGPGYLAWLDGFGFSSDPADYPIVDITDDGIGNGTVNSGDVTLHQLGDAANPTRLAYVANCTAASDGGGPDGHGHINVSIAGGYDARAGFPFQDDDGFQLGLGINPYGRFAGTRIFTSVFDLSGCGNSETGLIKQIQDSGAQISSNSWGCDGCAGTYDAASQAYDVGVRDADLTEPGNQELTFIFAAGNNGRSGSGTVGTPGNGKNVITVGASENDRPAWIDGCGVAPTGADNALDVIGFSGRGPAPGNRVKPELVAPGTHIQGTASSNDAYNGSGVCDQFQPGGQTLFAASSGTSHSTPAVAGAASLTYYWLENQHSLPAPSPALMKAYLIAHPTYLTGVSANDDLPSNNQGYGMPNMSLAFDDTPRYILDQSVVLSNPGAAWTFSGGVADPGKPLRIVLAYTDQEGLVGTSPQVNDLNLTVVVDGQTYLGNVFSGQWSVTGGAADSANNSEAVFLPSGAGSALAITVTGFNIAGDGLPNNGDLTDQDFALVCYNCTALPDFTLAAAPSAQAICVPDTAVYDITVGQIAGYADPVTLSASGIFTSAFSANPVVPPGNSQLVLSNTGAVATGDYAVTLWGIAPTSTHTTTVNLTLYDGLPGSITLTAPVNGITDTELSPTFMWPGTSQAASYLLEVAEDAAFNTVVYSATLKGTEHTLPQELAALTTYYWRVRADNACGAGAPAAPFSLTTALIACSAPGLAIPDGDANGVSSDLLVTEAVMISDLNVLLAVSHSWVGDLNFTLEHLQTGARVTLVDRPGFPALPFGCSGDDIEALLDDETAVPVEDACALSGLAISGSVAPNEPLSTFDGEFWPGVWRLTAVDDVPLDKGVLNRWCLLPSFEIRLDHNRFLPLVWK